MKHYSVLCIKGNSRSTWHMVDFGENHVGELGLYILFLLGMSTFTLNSGISHKSEFLETEKCIGYSTRASSIFYRMKKIPWSTWNSHNLQVAGWYPNRREGEQDGLSV